MTVTLFLILWVSIGIPMMISAPIIMKAKEAMDGENHEEVALCMFLGGLLLPIAPVLLLLFGIGAGFVYLGEKLGHLGTKLGHFLNAYKQEPLMLEDGARLFVSGDAPYRESVLVMKDQKHRSMKERMLSTWKKS
jgi:hypothetical protein